MKCVEVLDFKKDVHYQTIKDLYKKSFPTLERYPLFLLNKHLKNKLFSLTKYLDDSNDDLLGFTIIATYGGLNYISFLAVDPTKRNMGIGSKIIDYLLEKYQNKSLVLCVEYFTKDTKEDDIRVRRINFYKRKGFISLPYLVTLFGVKYYLLGNTSEVDLTNYCDVYKKIFGKLFFSFFRKKYRIDHID